MGANAYRGLFFTATSVLMLAALVPTFALYINLPNTSEEFSELWLRGPNLTAEGYPFNVTVGKTYSLYVGVGNHLGYAAYYKVYIRLINDTQLIHNSSFSAQTALDPIYEIQFFLANGKTWEVPIEFSLMGRPTLVSSTVVNAVVFPTNCSSTWNQERNGFYYQLFFELWLYNVSSHSFQYHDRLVWIWLNATE